MEKNMENRTEVGVVCIVVVAAIVVIVVSISSIGCGMFTLRDLGFRVLSHTPVSRLCQG